jgi:hypothetical protein
LIVINEQYYQSFYCQAEAEYAFELRKKNDSNFSASELYWTYQRNKTSY